ncbi:hypothetical protein CU102_25070 [Phyllobacterium brassicacearum]|uniref:Uncharacterized protein n=1 Tax=Phyllobacterium brassicacearum TaxID=314235 RepID=A0A2P7B860_9HYPH|nr:hypothetical protein CU102_25070 [Phyllobacterium brassicacearum]TDQ14864.1 hypothetical protein DEV91_13626 [Phyllobacterium brassicacearum]
MLPPIFQKRIMDTAEFHGVYSPEDLAMARSPRHGDDWNLNRAGLLLNANANPEMTQSRCAMISQE